MGDRKIYCLGGAWPNGGYKWLGIPSLSVVRCPGQMVPVLWHTSAWRAELAIAADRLFSKCLYRICRRHWKVVNSLLHASFLTVSLESNTCVKKVMRVCSCNISLHVHAAGNHHAFFFMDHDCI